MIHKLRDVRTKEILTFNDEELRKFIIEKTHCIYEDKEVLAERTGVRYHKLRETIKEATINYHLVSNLFLVTAIKRVNDDKKTRYLLISNGSIDESILELIQPWIPVYVFEKPDDESSDYATFISKWFRSNMGRAFSFIDIDYLLFDRKMDRALMIEEKDCSFIKMGYGQEISYQELLNDVFNVKSLLLVARTGDMNNMYILVYKKGEGSSGKMFKVYEKCGYYSQYKLKEFVKQYLEEKEDKV